MNIGLNLDKMSNFNVSNNPINPKLLNINLLFVLNSKGSPSEGKIVFVN